MTNKIFFTISFLLVICIGLALGITFQKATALPLDEPRYDILFKKILVDPDLDLDVDGTLKTEGRIKAAQKINAYSWADIKKEMTPIIEWEDLKLQAISCANGYVQSIGESSTCATLFGHYFVVAGTGDIPSACGGDALLVDGRCYKFFLKMQCAPGYTAIKTPTALYCLLKPETVYCPNFFDDAIEGQIYQKGAKCIHRGGGQNFQDSDQERMIQCLGKSFIQGIFRGNPNQKNDNQKGQAQKSILCGESIKKVCPPKYVPLEGGGDTLTCRFQIQK